MSLRVCLAGQLAVEVGGTPVPTAGVGPLGRIALAYLVLERDRPVPRDELADVLWGERLPRSWETSVRVLVSKLRALLARAGLAPAEALSTRAGCYQLHLPEGAAVDVEVAAAGVATAAAALAGGRPDAAQAAAAGAAAIAARRFLPGDGGAWVERRQAELRAVHLQALGLLSAGAAACSDWTTAVRAAEEAIGLEPFHEQTWVGLMRAHAAAGNGSEARRTYERCRRLLADELGVGPSPATLAAHDELEAGTGGASEGEPAPRPAPAVAAVPATRPVPLPVALTSFVGREDDLAEVATLLASTRLLTLIGTGGVGKTRLALQAARVLGPSGPPERDTLGPSGPPERETPGASGPPERKAPGPPGAGVEGGAGVVLVELASLTDPRLVDAQVLSALGVTQEPGRTPVATLVAALEGRRLLLILDNCEHLLAACAVLAEALLSRCPGLTILATSREPLRIPAERTLRVRSLSVPGRTDASAVAPAGGELLGYEAVRLFAERAAAASGIRITEENAAAAARICAELDGIPLALELAAARTGSLSLDDIADRLDDRFPLLATGSRTAPSRQRTLQGAVDWTYEALDADHQAAFRRLSVFAGDFTLDAAEHLWRHGTAGVLDLVTGLVDCSVLVAETGRARAAPPTETDTTRTAPPTETGTARAAPLSGNDSGPAEPPSATGTARTASPSGNDSGGAASGGGRPASTTGAPSGRRVGTTRYRLPETMRQYAAAKLGLEEAREARAGLVAWATALAEEADAGLLAGDRQPAWLDAVDAERDNLRAALGWATSPASPPGAGLPLATALGRFWEVRGHLSEGRRWLEAAVADDDGSRPVLRAQALNWAGILAQRQGDAVAARTSFQESLVIRRDEGDRGGVAAALHGLGNLAALQGDAATARAYFEECLAIGRELGEDQAIAASLANLGWVALNQGDLASARAYDEESLALRRKLGDRHGIAMLLGNLGFLAFQEGDFGAARAFDEESLALRQELGDRHGIAMLLGNLGHLALHEGDDLAARALYQESLALRRELGDRHGEAGSLANLAELARMEGDFATAGTLLGQALDLAQQLGDRYRTAALHVSLGRLAAAQGDLAGAEVCLRQALPAGSDALPQTTVAEWLEALATVAAGRAEQAWPGQAPSARRTAQLLGAAGALRTTIGAPVLPRNASPLDHAGAATRRILGDDAWAAAAAEGERLDLADAVRYGASAAAP